MSLRIQIPVPDFDGMIKTKIGHRADYSLLVFSFASQLVSGDEKMYDELTSDKISPAPPHP
jgi:hypothetical protein